MTKVHSNNCRSSHYSENARRPIMIYADDLPVDTLGFHK